MRFGLLILAWCCCAAIGVGAMVAYETTATPTREAERYWPATSEFVRDPQLPTLMMFIHPRCPCSRASLAELTNLASQCAGRVSLRTIFVQPVGCPEGWENTGLWRMAEQIPGATVVIDRDGIEADRFRATASGETFLYAADGRLLFHGGMTASRGHEGQSVGQAALAALINRQTACQSESRVYGCPLSNRSCPPVLESIHGSDQPHAQ